MATGLYCFDGFVHEGVVVPDEEITRILLKHLGEKFSQEFLFVIRSMVAYNESDRTTAKKAYKRVKRIYFEKYERH